MVPVLLLCAAVLELGEVACTGRLTSKSDAAVVGLAQQRNEQAGSLYFWLVKQQPLLSSLS
jgi:hypothetical protein